MLLTSLLLATIAPPPPPDPGADELRDHAMETAAFLMERFDANKDGFLDRDELIDANSWAKQQVEKNPANSIDDGSVEMADRMIERQDRDKDGRLSRQELEQARFD